MSFITRLQHVVDAVRREEASLKALEDLRSQAMDVYRTWELTSEDEVRRYPVGGQPFVLMTLRIY